MSSEEAFWIVPSPQLRARPNHVDGPYASLDEAQKVGEVFSFAFLIMRTRLSDTSLEIIQEGSPDLR